jgi:hypothetical protein
MIKYIYGLVLCVLIGSNAFGMQIRPDLQGKTYEELKQLEAQNEQEQQAFDQQYPNGEWRTSESLKIERDAIYDEGRALRNAIMFNAPRELIKTHCITVDQPVANTNDKKQNVAPDMKKYMRSFEQVSKSAHESARKSRKTSTQKNPHAESIAKVLKAQDELWDALCSSAQGKKGDELLAIAEQMDFIQDQKTALSDTLGSK